MEQAHLSKDLERGDSILGGRGFQKKKRKKWWEPAWFVQTTAKRMCGWDRASKGKNNRKGSKRTHRPCGASPTTGGTLGFTQVVFSLIHLVVLHIIGFLTTTSTHSHPI